MDLTPISDIRNRRDFHDSFQAAMSRAHETLRALWHFEKGQNLPKSYLVEFHPKDSSQHTHKWSTGTVFSALERATKHYGGHLRRTDDDTLLLLGNNDVSGAEFIIDCLNPRFLVFHTISNRYGDVPVRDQSQAYAHQIGVAEIINEEFVAEYLGEFQRVSHLASLISLGGSTSIQSHHGILADSELHRTLAGSSVTQELSSTHKASASVANEWR